MGIPGRAAGDNVAIRPASRPWVTAESYWEPPRIVLSGWLEHAPFAAWLMAAKKPRTLVELGTHSGYSFFTFCDAVQRLGLSTTCFAIDTWEGDEHAGFYGNEVFDDVSSIASELYADTAVLLRGRFDDYVDSFEDGSIDVLHIDGRHRYEDVKHDFETWHPKVASDGIVLFHDITVTERGFGVLPYWQEVSRESASFAFDHGNGLGVLANGAYSRTLGSLFEASDETANEVRNFYYRRGRVMTIAYVKELEAENELRARSQDLQTKETELHATGQVLAATETELRAAIQALQLRNDALAVREHELQTAWHKLDELHRSRSWRVTRPLRALRSFADRVRGIERGGES